MAEEGAARVAVDPVVREQRPLHLALDREGGERVLERRERRIEGVLVAADRVLVAEAARADARDLAGGELRAALLVAAVELERDRDQALLDHVAGQLAELRLDERAQRLELGVVG